MSFRTTGDGLLKWKRSVYLSTISISFGARQKHRACEERPYGLHLEAALPSPDDIFGGHLVPRPTLDARPDMERPRLEVLTSFPLVDPPPNDAFVAGGVHRRGIDAVRPARLRAVLHQVAAIGQCEHVLDFHGEGDLVESRRARRIGGRQRVAGFRLVGRNGAISGEGVVDAEDERSKPCGARGRKSLKQEFPTRGIDVPVGEKSTILHNIFHGSIPFSVRGGFARKA